MKSKLFIVLALSITSFYTKAQSLEEQFNAMIEKSSTYDNYKVIKISEINDFWKNVDESTKAKSAEIQRLQSQVNSLQVEIDSAKSQLIKVKSDLVSSLEVNDSIQFLGMELTKSTYHIIVWVIILILIVLSVMAYLMYMNSNKTTSRVKKDYAQLNKELEAHKDKAREMQVKLKRELQTANNTIEEMKRGGPSRR